MSDPVVVAPDGAFTIDGGGYGQDVEEASVRALFSVPKFGSASNDSLFESQLLKLPLDALQSFQPMIPGSTDADFSSVGGAVGKIMSALVDGAGVVIKALQATINQIIDIFNGLVVTPINNAVQGVLNWFRGLLGWQSETETKQTDLANSVWSGATSQEVELDRTAREVQSAVAAMKARAEALRTENELRYRSSVPLYQGLIPGGDVTCNLETVSVLDNLVLDVAGNTSEVAGHVHGSGTLTATMAAVPNPVATSSGELSSGPMATFRVRSDTPRNVISFMAKGVGSISAAYVSLWSYDYETDVWRCVGVSNDFASAISPTYDWVDTTLTEEYSPSMSELMGVRWSVAGSGSLHVASSYAPALIPKYHSVPYGSAVMTTASIRPEMGDAMSLTSEAQWWNGGIPYAQIAPDLGQVFQAPPQYWFDDFNTDTNSMYTRLNGAKISGGRFGYTGAVDGSQHLIYKGQMSTPSFAVAATADKFSSRWMYLRHGSSVNGTNGVVLRFEAYLNNDDMAVNLYTVSSSNAESYTLVKSVSVPEVPGRWTIEFDDTTKTYTVKQEDNVVLTWADPANLAQRGKGKRSGGIGTARLAFVNAGTWDDLLIYDLALEEEDPLEEA